MACRTPIAAFALIVGGCSWISPEEKDTTLEGSSPKGGITIEELEREVRQLADRGVARVAEACDQIKRQAKSWEIYQRAHLAKVRTAMAVYDAVTTGDPLRELLELTVLIELGEIIWVEEGEAVRIFGDDWSKPLIAALEHTREEAWELTTRVLKKDQQERLKAVIREWRARNPEVQVAAFSRFSSGAWYQGSSLLTDILSLGGILDPLRSTSRTVEETRHVAERIFFYAKRLPTVLEWETEAAAWDIVDRPRMNRLMTDVSSASATITRLPDEAHSLVLYGFLAAAGLIVLTFLLAAGYKSLFHRLEVRSRSQPKALVR